MRTALVVLSLLFGCSKSGDRNAGSAAPVGSGGGSSATGSGSGAASPEPSEAAAVVGPTKSASGVLELGGAIAGKFEWIKKDQLGPISCAWSPEKEIGGLRVDLSDGAGRLVKVTIDVPPPEVGSARLDVTSTSLPSPLKTKFGFNMSGDEPGRFEVKFDATLADEKGDKPGGPTLTIKGTLEVTCPTK
jgi:hypothetical protein